MSRIVFEGLPGGGKTTLSAWLSTSVNWYLLRENVLDHLVFIHYLKEHEDDSRIYQLNWEIKDYLASRLRKNCIFDRNHLTSLAYNYAKSKIFNDKTYYEDSYKWYRHCRKQNMLNEPDIYVVIRIKPSLCNERKGRVYNNNMLWSSEDALSLSEYYYENFESILDIKKTKILKVNSDNENGESIKQEILNEINPTL